MKIQIKIADLQGVKMSRNNHTQYNIRVQGRVCVVGWHECAVIVPFKEFNALPEDSDKTFEGSFFNQDILYSEEFVTVQLTDTGKRYDDLDFRVTRPEPIDYVPLTGMNDLLKNLNVCASQDESRLHLNGVNFAVNKGVPTIAATDGYRLGVITMDNIKSLDYSVIVHRSAIKAALKTVRKKGDLGTLELSKQTSYFSGIPIRIFYNNIDLEYPPFNKVIPNDFEFSISLNRKQVLVFAKKAKKAKKFDSYVHFICTYADVGCTVMAGDNSNEKFEAIIDGTHNYTENSDNPFTIAFNSQYVIDAMNAFDVDFVTMHLTSSLCAAMINTTDNPDFKYVIMPARM